MQRDLGHIRKNGKSMILGLAAETKERAGLMAKKKEAKIKQLAN